MRPRPGEVLHFSEDPTITRFAPRIAATSAHVRPYVWAVDHARCPDYWFPRQCPRALAWVTPSTSDTDRERIIGAGGGERVHAIEYGIRLRNARPRPSPPPDIQDHPTEP